MLDELKNKFLVQILIGVVIGAASIGVVHYRHRNKSKQIEGLEPVVPEASPVSAGPETPPAQEDATVASVEDTTTETPVEPIAVKVSRSATTKKGRRNTQRVHLVALDDLEDLDDQPTRERMRRSRGVEK